MRRAGSSGDDEHASERGVFSEPTRLDEKPRRRHDGQELQPQEQGRTEPLDLATTLTLERARFQQEKRRDLYAARAHLQQVDEQHRGNARERQKAERIPEAHAAGSTALTRRA